MAQFSEEKFPPISSLNMSTSFSHFPNVIFEVKTKFMIFHYILLVFQQVFKNDVTMKTAPDFPQTPDVAIYLCKRKTDEK